MKLIILKIVLFVTFLLQTNYCFSQYPFWSWAKAPSGDHTHIGSTSCTADSAGNSYVIGRYGSDTIYFGSIPVSHTWSYISFIAKYDTNGNVLWAKNVGDGTAYGVAVDSHGNVYVTGEFDGTFNFGNITISTTVYSNMFVAKYDSLGNEIWAKNASANSGFMKGKSLSLDPSGNIYVAGTFSSLSAAFGAINLTNTSVPSSEIFLAKYDNDGNVLWAKSAGGTDLDNVNSVAVDNSGNAFITGYFFSPTISFGSITLNIDIINYANIYIAKYNSTGNVMWVKNTQGSSQGMSYTVAIDNSGNAIIGGYFASPQVIFGSFTLVNAGYYLENLFYVKYDTNGNVLWAKSAGGYSSCAVNSIVTDNYGNIYLGGTFEYLTLTIGTVYLTNGENMFIVKVDANGNPIWGKTPDTSNGQEPTKAIGIDYFGNLYITGNLGEASLKFGSTTLINVNYAITLTFIAKLSVPPIQIIQTNVSCNGGSNGSATASLTGAPTACTYIWNTVPQQTSSTATGLVAGEYSVTVTSNSGTSYNASVTIVQPPEIIVNVSKTICSGNTYDFNGHIYSTSGIYYDTLASINGCDSILKLSLFVDPLDTTVMLQTICQGSSYNFYGTDITLAGIYYHTLISSNGCDSVISMNLSLNPVFFLNNPQTICNGDSFYFNGHTYSNTGLYQDTLHSILGCDSIIATQLTVNSTFITYNPQIICNGDAYVFNSNTYTANGNYNDTLSTSLGCDSIIITQLTVKPVFFTTILKSICVGETYAYNGFNYSATGNYYDSLTTVHGCDSIVELSLVVYPIDTTVQFTTICQGESYNFYGTVLTSQGTYYNTLLSTHGCDSIIVCNLNVIPMPIINLPSDTSFCSGETLTFNVTQLGNFPYTYYWDNGSASPIISTNTAGVLTIYISDSTICQISQTLNVIELSLPIINFPTDTSVCTEHTYILNAFNPYSSYFWNDGSTYPQYQVQQSGLFSVSVTNQCGVTTDTVNVEIIDCLSYLDVPSAFSPNDDGNNDILYAVGNNVDNVIFIIYDRWGNKVFESKELLIGWDGTYNGKKMDTNVFMYYITALSTADGKAIQKKGNISLIR